MEELLSKGPFAPKDRTLVVLTLSEKGSKSFTYLKGASEGQRELYFIDQVRDGCISQATMLLGQFLFEFLKDPKDALTLSKGGTNRIYFPNSSDVTFFEKPSEEEINLFVEKMNKLAEDHPIYQEMVKKILDDVEIQKNSVEEPCGAEQVEPPKAGSLIKVVLSEHGVGISTCIKNAVAGQQELYYVDSIEKGPVAGWTTLSGNFLAEYEDCPEKALSLNADHPNKLYFPQDKRIISYEIASKEDIEMFNSRMFDLEMKNQLRYTERIDQILLTLPS